MTARAAYAAAVVAASLAASVLAVAADDNAPGTYDSRPSDSKLTLRMADGTVFTETTAGLPYVSFYDGPVMAPGEVMTVRFRPGEALGDSKFVRIAPADAGFAHGDGPAALLKGAPPGTVIITYVQEADSPDMVLRIDHNLPRAIAYDVSVERLRDGKWNADAAAMCAVSASEARIRKFPEPTKRIFFHRFHYAAAADVTAGCP